MTSKFPRSQSDQASGMCWNNKRNPSRPHLQLTGLQGSTAHVLVPDTKGHLLGSCGAKTCFGGTSGTYTILGGFNVVAVTVCMYVQYMRSVDYLLEVLDILNLLVILHIIFAFVWTDTVWQECN